MKTAVTHQAPASPALSAGVFFRRAGTTRNQNLPGMGGVYNLVNLHVYHYAGNNPVKYIDPDGRDISLDNDEGIIKCDLTKKDLEDAAVVFQLLSRDGKFKGVVATDKQTGSSLEFYSHAQLQKRMGLMSNSIDHSSVNAFLTSLGFTASTSTMREIDQLKDIIGNHLMRIIGRIFMNVFIQEDVKC